MQSACAVLYCHLWPVWLYHIFLHYLINGTIFGKPLLNIKCVFWFSLHLLSETFLILRRIQRDITINVHRSSCRVPLLSDFNETWIFWTDFRKILISNFLKIRPSGSLVVPCGRTQTDMTKLIVAFRNFANALKKWVVNVFTPDAVGQRYNKTRTFWDGCLRNVVGLLAGDDGLCPNGRSLILQCALSESLEDVCNCSN
jgi:hypothetical protein